MKIAMVGQEPVLFNRTIKENIAYGLLENDENSSKDDSAIIRAAEQANAHGFITDLVKGYNTLCGQRGGHLSGKRINNLLLSSNSRLSPRWTKATCVHRSCHHS